MLLKFGELEDALDEEPPQPAAIRVNTARNMARFIFFLRNLSRFDRAEGRRRVGPNARRWRIVIS
jgi:hypothetical protein